MVGGESSEEQVGGEGEREPAPGATGGRVGGLSGGDLVALAGPIRKPGAGAGPVGDKKFTGDVPEELAEGNGGGLRVRVSGIGIGGEPEEVAEGDQFIDGGVWELGEEIDLSEPPQVPTGGLVEPTVQLLDTQLVGLLSDQRESDNLGDDMIERDVDGAVIGHGGSAGEKLDR
jgi:hypothetical protein